MGMLSVFSIDYRWVVRAFSVVCFGRKCASGLVHQYRILTEHFLIRNSVVKLRFVVGGALPLKEEIISDTEKGVWQRRKQRGSGNVLGRGEKEAEERRKEMLRKVAFLVGERKDNQQRSSVVKTIFAIFLVLFLW